MSSFNDFFQTVGSGMIKLWENSPIAALAVVLAALGFLAFIVWIIGLGCVELGIINPRLPKVDSRIGYKRAWLEGDSFKGVVGIPYDVNEEARGPGFHAYRSFKKAFNHPQKGNVFLEVLLSGNIQEHDLGYTASHQRVLQVIAGNCSECNQSATHYFLDPKPTVEPAPLFLCQRHARLPSRVKARLSVQKLSNRLRGDNFDQPIERLAEDFDWLKEAGVVTAPYSGENRFIPTKLPSKE